ncbi:hypothetical protein CT19431_P70082 [Cupriavidus taiwanensis]|nr:hypothetical protein CT19431_P70082 [Cupriavidus taiwanensis]
MHGMDAHTVWHYELAQEHAVQARPGRNPEQHVRRIGILDALRNANRSIARRHQPYSAAIKRQGARIISLAWKDLAVLRHDYRLLWLGRVQRCSVNRSNPAVVQLVLSNHRWVPPDNAPVVPVILHGQPQSMWQRSAQPWNSGGEIAHGMVTSRDRSRAGDLLYDAAHQNGSASLAALPACRPDGRHLRWQRLAALPIESPLQLKVRHAGVATDQLDAVARFGTTGIALAAHPVTAAPLVVVGKSVCAVSADRARTRATSPEGVCEDVGGQVLRNQSVPVSGRPVLHDITQLFHGMAPCGEWSMPETGEGTLAQRTSRLREAPECLFSTAIGSGGRNGCGAKPKMRCMLPRIRGSMHIAATYGLSERNLIIIHIFEAMRRRLLRAATLAASATTIAALTAAGLAAFLRLAAIAIVAVIVRRSAAATQHLHLIGNDLGAVLVLARLILPLAGANASLNINGGALLQVLPCDLSQLAEERNAVPFSGFLHLAALLVLIAIGGSDTNIGHSVPAGHVANLRICPEIANENDFVHGCHVASLLMNAIDLPDPTVPEFLFPSLGVKNRAAGRMVEGGHLLLVQALDAYAVADFASGVGQGIFQTFALQCPFAGVGVQLHREGGVCRLAARFAVRELHFTPLDQLANGIVRARRVTVRARFGFGRSVVWALMLCSPRSPRFP